MDELSAVWNELQEVKAERDRYKAALEYVAKAATLAYAQEEAEQALRGTEKPRKEAKMPPDIRPGCTCSSAFGGPCSVH